MRSHDLFDAGLLASAVLLAVGCGGGAPEAEDVDTVVLATPTAEEGKPQRKPRPTAKAYGAVPVSLTFPKGLDWTTEPPGGYAPTPNGATPSMADEGAPLAVKLADAVLATKTELVADGPTVVMRVPESGELRLQMPLQPTRCYGAYAMGDAGVVELDAQFVFDPSTGGPPGLAALPAVVIAQDNDTGPTATIGMNGNCFKAALPIPIPAVLRVTAKTGSGLVAVQLFADRAAVPPP